MELPSVIPIFPLPSVVLFPGVPLPLHIFEPRYRDMVRDAAAGHEIIGMTMLRGDWQKDYDGNPEVFGTGCAGKLVNVEALPDGRYNIVLLGLREFEIRRDVFERTYRQAEVAWRAVGRGALAEADRARLIDLLSRFLREEPQSPAHRLLRDPSLTDDLLVNFFAYALDIDPLEKQGLLQAGTLIERGRRLAENIEFHIEAARLAPVRRSGPDRCH
ncbi:LON peptidase substrate-binding domain-containing protein [Candidatus Binatia bacterium]|nr:LON peptidase substrate-binding domain-containing protein [Candidatus Binatia bacterium]